MIDKNSLFHPFGSQPAEGPGWEGFEYQIPEGSDAVKEVAKCVQY
jgi:hypothetical protein